MLRFFREKAAFIGWSIIIAFAVTMLAGSLYLGFFSGAPEEQPVQRQQSNFVSIGNRAMNPAIFSRVMQTNLNQIYSQTQRVSPLQVEYVMASAFQTALQQAVFEIGAEEAGMTLTKDEKKNSLREFLIENNFKTEKELKAALKERGISEKAFRKEIEKNALVRKYRNQLMADVQGSDQLLYNVFKQVRFEQITVENTKALNEAEWQLVLTELASDLKASDLSSLTDRYKERASISIQDSTSFLQYFQLAPTFREALYSLELGDVSSDLSDSADTALFLKLLDVNIQEKPADADEEALMQQLLTTLKNEAISQKYSEILEDNPIIIHMPELRAVHEKTQGNIEGALAAYQTMISNRPSAPAPHFFRAEIYASLDNKKKMMDELKKADLKSELDANFDFPELHLFYADQLVERDKNEAIKQYNKALALVKTDANFLNLIREAFVKLNYAQGVTEVDVALEALEASQKAVQESE